MDRSISAGAVVDGHDLYVFRQTLLELVQACP